MMIQVYEIYYIHIWYIFIYIYICNIYVPYMYISSKKLFKGFTVDIYLYIYFIYIYIIYILYIILYIYLYICMAYWIHGHICHIWRPKLRGQFSKKLVLWTYEFLFNSVDRISKQKEVMEILRIKNLKYDRIFQFTNCLWN